MTTLISIAKLNGNLIQAAEECAVDFTGTLENIEPSTYEEGWYVATYAVQDNGIKIYNEIFYVNARIITGMANIKEVLCTTH